MSKVQKGADSKAREQWSGQLGFLMAAIGSAIGLGNIWRFPAVAYENGGGAFLVPYLIALLTAGVPALLLDYSVGHRFRGSAPLSFRRIHPKAEIIGWWQVLISFIIMVYYAVVIAWAGQYLVYSFNQAWGDDPAKFFNESFLQLGQPGTISLTPVWGIFISLTIVWVVVLVIIANGTNGLEKANKFFLPLLVVLFAAMVVRAVTLPGATEGLNVFFEPDWSKLFDSKVWIAAYSQIFYSLSICFGIMITYSSYLDRKSNLSGSGYVAAFANSSFEILAGIGVFAALGFMAMQQGITVDKLEGISGLGLSFVTFPKLISLMPGGGSVFGVLFFASLVLAGVTSLISLVQVVSGAFQDKFGWTVKKAALIIGGVAMVCSLVVFSTHTGLFALDVVDAYINELGLVSSAIIMCVFISVGMLKLPELRKHLNAVSSIKTGKWWELMVGYLLPTLLSSMIITAFIRFFTEGYGDYPTWYTVLFGWGSIGLGIVLSIVYTLVPWKHSKEEFEPMKLDK